MMYTNTYTAPGRFSKAHLLQYLRLKQLSSNGLQALRKPHKISQQELEKHLNLKLTQKEFHIIQQYGLVGAALFVKGVDWELVAIVTGKLDVYQMIISLDQTPGLIAIIGEKEATALRLLANTCRLSKHMGKRNNSLKITLF